MRSVFPAVIGRNTVRYTMPKKKKPTKPRDTMTYELVDGKEVVYRGKTNDLERREREHRQQGKEFTKIRQTSRRMTEEGAGKKEREQLKTYRKNHGGKNPKYNETDHG